MSKLPQLPYAWYSLVAVPYKKEILAIGGLTSIQKVTNKVFAWDEDNKRWTTPYTNMPTARSKPSCVSYGSAVIVAGGRTCYYPRKSTGAVEVLYITEQRSKSHWSVVEQLPHIVCEAVPLIIDALCQDLTMMGIVLVT